VRLGTGIIATGLVMALTLGTLVAVALRSEAAAGLAPADWAAVRFTVLQAALSAAASVILAIPVARALARRRFSGRSLLVLLMGAPFILPVIVAVLGLLAVFGQNGLLSVVLGWAGLGPVRIYGLHGIVLAHVFLNLPLVTRLLLQGWQSIPAERLRLAASLGMSATDRMRFLEFPMLRAALPGAFLVVFLICTTSFAVVLTLGGGPRATTIELAIYQAFRFDFDLGKAALLAIVQFTIGGAAAALAWRVALPAGFGGGLDRPARDWGAQTPALLVQDTLIILLAGLFVAAPLTMIVLQGITGMAHLPVPVMWAALRSLAVALTSAGLVLALALPMALLIEARRGWTGGLIESIGHMTIAASPMVVGTGLFIILFPVADPVALALPVTARVNALTALPFALRAIGPPLQQTEASFGRLADSLALTGTARLRLLILPRLRRPIGFALGLSAALSMGDLGVIALFAAPDHATLPLQLYRLMAAYRMQDAAAAALLLLIGSLAIFWVFDRGGRLHADA